MGNDVTCSEFSGQVFRSTAAVPIVYRNMTIGCVYICEEDAVQGALLLNLQKNLRSISLVVAAVTLVMSLFFAQMLSSRFTALLSAIRIVGGGSMGTGSSPRAGTSWPCWRRSLTSSLTVSRPRRRCAGASYPTPPTS